MEWKNGKIVKAVIKSTLGGNLRIRVPNEMKLATDEGLRKAIGENTNPFYHTEKTADPIISEKAIITPPSIKETFVYDVVTKVGQEVSLIIK